MTVEDEALAAAKRWRVEFIKHADPDMGWLYRVGDTMRCHEGCCPTESQARRIAEAVVRELERGDKQEPPHE